MQGEKNTTVEEEEEGAGRNEESEATADEGGKGDLMIPRQAAPETVVGSCGEGEGGCLGNGASVERREGDSVVRPQHSALRSLRRRGRPLPLLGARVRL